jgi:Fic family protein
LIWTFYRDITLDMPTWDVRFDLNIDLSAPHVVSAVAQINAFSRINASLPIPPDVRLHFNRLYIHRAVAGTTDIEGADVTEEEVARILETDPTEPVLPRSRAREEQEVRNAAAVMDHIAALLTNDPDLPLTEALICRIHELMTAGIPYQHNTPGVYRSHAVSAGTYTPPRTHGEVTLLMREFSAWLRGSRAAALPPVVRAIAAHFYFVSIHPFGDGNGRTARAVESFLLYQGKLNALGFYSLANFYYQQRDAYIAGLDHARFRSGNDLTPFILFATRGLVGELQTVMSEVLESLTRIAYRDFVQNELARAGKSAKTAARLYELVAGLSNPVLLAEIRRGTHALSHLYWRLNPKTLTRDIEFLQSLKLIVVTQGTVSANLELMHA